MQFFATMEKLVLRYYNFFLEGVRNTLIIAFFAVLLGTVLGTLMAMARMSRIKPLKWLATAYIEFFRGTPLMVQLMFIFYGLPMIGVTFPSVSFIPDFDRFAAGIVAMSLNSCAYLAEIIRSGIQAVDKGQTEAARSLGLSEGQTMVKIILPQAVRNILPALGNEFIMMLKETSLASTFFLGDVMTSYLVVKGVSYLTLEPLTIVAIIYLCVTYPLSKIVDRFGKKMANPNSYRSHKAKKEGTV